MHTPACVTLNARFLILIAPVRVPPALTLTEYPTDALPVDVAPPVIVSQLALLVAVQGHPIAAETAIAPLAAALLRLALGGAIPSTVHEDWLSGTRIPPMVTVADRGEASKLGETEMLTEPSPFALNPGRTLAQVLSELAVQEHPEAAETEMLYVPPPTAADSVIGLRVTLQD